MLYLSGNKHVFNVETEKHSRFYMKLLNQKFINSKSYIIWKYQLNLMYFQVFLFLVRISPSPIQFVDSGQRQN